MRIIRCKTYEDFSKEAAKIVGGLVSLKPNAVLGLPTGDTPKGMYANLAEMDLDFSDVTTFNLDEYVGLDKDHDQGYYYFMNKNLYSKVNLKLENVNVPSGVADDLQGEALKYDEKIAAMGGLDIMVLGIGNNGHIGFNEPDSMLDARTHVVELTDRTIEANSRFFASKADVPTKAVTMGLGSIMKAKKILMLASGKNKEDVVKDLLGYTIKTENPASMLLMHPDVTVIIDESSVNL